MKHEDRFDKYAAEIEQDLEDGYIDKHQFRAQMRELIAEFTEDYNEGWDG